MIRHVLSIIWRAIWFWPWEGTYCPEWGTYDFDMRKRTVHHLGSSTILIWEGTYCPSSAKIYDFDLRRSPSWGALHTRTVHHLGSSMILTWEGTLTWFWWERYVMSIIWGALWFWHEKARTAHQLGSSTILRWGTYCPSSGELYDFDMRSTYCPSSGELYDFDRMRSSTRTVHPSMILTWGHVLSYDELYLTWEGMYSPYTSPLSEELYDFDMRRHVLSIIWGSYCPS